MWSGTEWIPAPPSITNKVPSKINIQDSVMQGNVNFNQNSDRPSSTINLSDSAMSGDINIAHNDIDGIVLGVRIAEHEKWAEKVLTSPLFSQPSWAEITSDFIAGQRNLMINPSSTHATRCCNVNIGFGESRKCGLPIGTQSVIPSELHEYEYIFLSRAFYHESCNFHRAGQIHMWTAGWFENHQKRYDSDLDLHSFYQQRSDEDFWEYAVMSFNKAMDAYRLHGK